MRDEHELTFGGLHQLAYGAADARREVGEALRAEGQRLGMIEVRVEFAREP